MVLLIMTDTINTQKPKSKRKAVNITLDEQTVKEAREFDINISQVADEMLKNAVKREKERRWLEENREAIEAHNERVRKHGVLIQPYWRRQHETI